MCIRDRIPAGSTGNKIFYAKWEAINYSITYYLGGGSSNPDNPVTVSYTHLDVYKRQVLGIFVFYALGQF